MCEMNVTKQELDLIIGRLEDAIKVCYSAPENPKDEGILMQQDLHGQQCKEQWKTCSG